VPALSRPPPPAAGEPIDVPVALGLLGLHLGALAALWHFSWFGLGLAILLYWLTSSLGVSLGFHRMLSHRAFSPVGWLRAVLVILGCLALQGRPFYWVGVHRLHHANPDGPEDPHSPRHGFWWAHFGWIVRQNTGGEQRVRVIGDLMRDRTLVLLNRWCPWAQLSSAVVLYGMGELARVGGVATSGWSGLLWGVGMRSVAAYHATWLVNSAAHRWGYVNYRTSDDAKNLWWVALLSFGEGWHNNHHAHPYSARVGHRWFEVDLTWFALRALQVLGLVTQVRGVAPGFAHRSTTGGDDVHSDIGPAAVQAPGPGRPADCGP
jgi:fatty-acid desaturase